MGKRKKRKAKPKKRTDYDRKHKLVKLGEYKKLNTTYPRKEF